MKRLKAYCRTGNGGSLKDIPYIAKDRLYILVLANHWKTLPNKTFRENIEHFADRLQSNYVIELSDQEAIEVARKKFNSRETDEPVLTISNIHPNEWDPEENKNDGIKLIFARLNNDELIEELSSIIYLVENNASFKKMNWAHRKLTAKRLLKKTPVLSILGAI